VRSLPLLLLLAATCVGAQTVYKCKAPDGRISYSNRPCAAAAESMEAPTLPGSHRAAATVATPPARCYEPGEIKDIDDWIASAKREDDRSFLRSERQRVLGCKLAPFSIEDRQRRIEALSALASDDAQRRAKAKSDIEQLYAKVAAAPPPAVAAAPASPAAPVVQKTGYRVMINGRPYETAKQGLIDAETGKLCHPVGNNVACD